MGYGLTVYVLDIDDLTELCGSKNDRLWQSIGREFQDSITRTNRQLDYGNEIGEPSVLEAIRHLIMGEEKTLNGTLYGYGLEYIVRYLGRFLNNNLFCPCTFQYLREDIGEQLAATGASVKIDDLLFFHLPFKLPVPDDFPCYGSWSAAAVEESVEPLQNSKNKSPELQAILEWLETATKEGKGIIGYYY